MTSQGNGMNRVLATAAAFIGICLILLGVIFIVAWSLENALAGTVMLLIGGALIYFSYRTEKIEAARPKLVSQTYNVTMGGSGELEQKRMTCDSCGAPLDEKDMKVVQGGLAGKCPYCGAAFAMQEAPKW